MTDRAAVWRIASATLLVIALIAVGRVVASGIGWLFGSDDGWRWFAADNLLAFIPPVVLLVLWLRRRERRGLADLGFRGPRRGARVLLGVATALALLVAVQVLSAVATGVGDTTGGADAAGEPDPIVVAMPLAAVLLLATVAVQASAEEILFRGYLLGAIRRSIGAGPAVLVSSVVFGLCHAINGGATVTYVAITMVLGVILGLLAVTDGSLWRSCAFHSAWNGVPALLAPATTSGESGAAGNTLGSAVVLVALLLAAAAAWWRLRVRRRRAVAPVGGS